MKKFIALLLSVLAIFAFTACGGGTAVTPDTLKGEDALELELSAYEVATVCGRKTDLPVPMLGGEETENVKVRIVTTDGKVFVPDYDYASLPAFRPNEAGTYYAVYTAVVNEKTQSKTARINVSEAPDAGEIKVDGVLDDAKYAEIPAYKTGINGNMTVRLAFGETGFYLGVDVKDDNLIYNTYVSKKFLQSDGFEVCLDFAGKSDPMLNDKCVKFQANVGGVVWISRASGGRMLYELDERLVNYSTFVMRYNGTRTDVASDDFKTYTDTDTGYVFEAYMPYELLGFTDIADTIGITCNHRDISSNVANEYRVGGSGNMYFTEAKLPDNFAEKNNQNTSYEFEHLTGASMTALYNKCYLTGNKGIAVSRNACEITVDGDDAEEKWNTAATSVELTATSAEGGTAAMEAKAFATEAGLYVFAKVADANVSSLAASDTFANDGVRILVASADDIGKSTLPAGLDTLSRSIVISATGQTRISLLGGDEYEFLGGMDIVKAVKRTATGYNVEIFVPAYEIGLNDSDFIGLCFGLVNCDGTATAASDAVYSGTRTAPNAYELVIKG